MEPDKIEKHMQKTLKERKISPSDFAWDAISKQLPLEEKSSNKAFYWYGIAAGVLVLLSFAFYFLQNKNALPDSVIVVEKEDKESTEQLLIQDSIEIYEPVVTILPKVNRIEKQQSKPKDLVNYKEPITTVEVEQEFLDKEETKFLELDSIIEIQVTSVLKQTQSLELATHVVTDKEIDSLLKKAQLEILTNKLFTKEKKVDAMALLNEAEVELDQSFREQIFKSLKSRFLKVRTAVADRNN